MGRDRETKSLFRKDVSILEVFLSGVGIQRFSESSRILTIKIGPERFYSELIGETLVKLELPKNLGNRADPVLGTIGFIQDNSLVAYVLTKKEAHRIACQVPWDQLS